MQWDIALHMLDMLYSTVYNLFSLYYPLQNVNCVKEGTNATL
jgi:hypothetical protein